MTIVKKILKWLGIVCGILLIIGLVVYIVLDITFGIELRHTIRDLRAKGRPMTLAEIMPQPVPDDQNSAPLIFKAVNLIPDSSNLNANALGRLVMLTTNRSYMAGTIDMTQWAELRKEETISAVHSDEMKQLVAFLEQTIPLPEYDNHLDYSKGPGLIVPNYGKYRMMIRLLAIKAFVEAQEGNVEQALNTIMIGFAVSQKLQKEPLIITQLVRIAFNTILLNSLQQMIANVNISEDQLQKLLDTISNSTDDRVWTRALDFERVGMGVWVFDRMLQGSFPDIQGIFNRNFGPGIVIVWVIWKPILKKDYSFYLKSFDQMQSFFEQPYYNKTADERKSFAQKLDSIPKYDIVTQLISPSFLTHVRIMDAAANIEVCRVGLALKLFKKKYGQYPETLEKLMPEFLATVPVDPCTGQSLVYKRLDNGFILYSLGSNMKDDNGTPRTPSKQIQDDDYDIVWKCAQ